MAVEETKAEMGDLEGAPRNATLTQIKQVSAYFLLAELVR